MNKLEKKIELATEDLDLFIKMYEEDYTIDGEVNKFMYIEDEDDMENYMLDIEKDKEDVDVEKTSPTPSLISATSWLNL